MNKNLVLLLAIFFTTVGHSALSGRPIKETSEEKFNVFQMKHKLEDQKRKVLELTREMNQIENSLGQQNKKYLKLSEGRTKLEEMLAQAKKNADFDSLNLKKNTDETRSVLAGLILNNLEKGESSADLLAKKIYIKNLQTRMIDLVGLTKSNSEIKAEVEELSSRLNNSITTEKDLVAIMNELEQKKKALHDQLLSESNKAQNGQSEFDEAKNKLAMEEESLKRAKKKVELAHVQITEEIKIPSARADFKNVGIAEYRSPIQITQGVEYKEKGVTFKFSGKNEVLATRAGKITYTGSLANYGNVVMIDHGNDTRTVLLGQFDYNVKNGDQVKESQVIGFTNPKSVNGLGDGKIYFEVRKNNLAQNTFLLLDKKTILKQ